MCSTQLHKTKIEQHAAAEWSKGRTEEIMLLGATREQLMLYPISSSATHASPSFLWCKPIYIWRGEGEREVRHYTFHQLLHNPFLEGEGYIKGGPAPVNMYNTFCIQGSVGILKQVFRNQHTL